MFIAQHQFEMRRKLWSWVTSLTKVKVKSIHWSSFICQGNHIFKKGNEIAWFSLHNPCWWVSITFLSLRYYKIISLAHAFWYLMLHYEGYYALLLPDNAKIYFLLRLISKTLRYNWWGKKIILYGLLVQWKSIGKKLYCLQ